MEISTPGGDVEMTLVYQRTADSVDTNAVKRGAQDPSVPRAIFLKAAVIRPATATTPASSG